MYHWIKFLWEQEDQAIWMCVVMKKIKFTVSHRYTEDQYLYFSPLLNILAICRPLQGAENIFMATLNTTRLICFYFNFSPTWDFGGFFNFFWSLLHTGLIYNKLVWIKNPFLLLLYVCMSVYRKSNVSVFSQECKIVSRITLLFGQRNEFDA